MTSISDPSPGPSTKRNLGGGGRTRNPNSLANLKRGETVAPRGNTRAMTHSFRSEELVKDVSAQVHEPMDAPAESAPVRNPDGGLPDADVVAVKTAARALKRGRSVSTWCDLQGRFDEKLGEVKPVAQYKLDGERSLQRCLDSLGMSPMARSKLGLNIGCTAQTFDLARHWQGAGRCLRAIAYSASPTALRPSSRSRKIRMRLILPSMKS